MFIVLRKSIEVPTIVESDLMRLSIGYHGPAAVDEMAKRLRRELKGRILIVLTIR